MKRTTKLICLDVFYIWGSICCFTDLPLLYSHYGPLHLLQWSLCVSLSHPLPLFVLSLSSLTPMSLLCISLSHTLHSHTPNPKAADGSGSLPAALSGQSHLCPGGLRNARSGAVVGTSEMLQNCLQSVAVESGNDEKLSVNSRLQPPALLQTGSLAFS